MSLFLRSSWVGCQFLIGVGVVQKGLNFALVNSEIMKIVSKSKPPRSNISKAEREAIKSLAKDDSVVILPADKGRTTVILNKQDYQNKVKTLLDDTNTYEKLNSDHRRRIRERARNTLSISPSYFLPVLFCAKSLLTWTTISIYIVKPFNTWRGSKPLKPDLSILEFQFQVPNILPPDEGSASMSFNVQSSSAARSASLVLNH